MLIVDDHLALLALAERLPDFGLSRPVATTWAFQFRMARAVSDSARSGSLSRRVVDSSAPTRRVLHPPANRLVVLDPRVSVEEAVRVAVVHRVSFLLASLVGAAISYQAAVRVTAANTSARWPSVMEREGIDFATVDL